VLRARLDYPELKRAVRARSLRWRPDVILIEDKASGTQLIQELLAEGLHAVTRYRPQADKVMRMHAQTAVPGLDPGIENGFVHLPQAADWLAEYLHELAVFPHGRYDDQVPPDTLFRGQRHSSSTGSRCPAARTASTHITGCAPRNCAASRPPRRPDRARPRGRAIPAEGRL
jgi:predicted phage terminase large subunit-like protein